MPPTPVNKKSKKEKKKVEGRLLPKSVAPTARQRAPPIPLL
jgi:hypothetical protein